MSREIIVSAIISDECDPERYIVDANGGAPSIPHEAGGGETTETTLHKLGRQIGLASLSAAYARWKTPHDVTYETKPISGDHTPSEGYTWTK